MKNIPKRITSLILTLSMVLSLVPFFCMPAFSASTTKLTGEGTADNPYLIKNATDLNTFRTELSDGTIPNSGKGRYFSLTSNITGLGAWTPIAQFNGTLDGRNHTISGIKINVTAQYVGFFAQITNAAIKNLHLSGDVAGGYSGTGYIGGLIGLSTNSKILNCSFDGTVRAATGTRSIVGGLISIAPGSTVSNCWTAGKVNSIRNNADSGFSDDGPFVGQSGNSGTLTVSKCYSSMNGSGCSDRGSSGLACYVQNGASQPIFTDCYSVGTGYTRAFSGAIPSGRTIKIQRCHVYNTEYKAVKHTYDTSSANGTLTCTNVYQLWNGNTVTSTNVTRRTEGIFADADGSKTASNKFTGWDFTNTWRIGTDSSGNKYPMLRQSVDITGNLRSKNLTYYDDDDNEFNLTDYFDLILSEDKDYKQEGRFQYEVTDPVQVTPQVWDNTTWSYTPGMPGDIATTNGDKLVLKEDAPVGTYTVTVHAVDTHTSTRFDDFDMTFTITKKVRVPAPVPSTYNFPYSRDTTLKTIGLSDGWKWAEPDTIPRDTASYEVIYPIDNSLKDYYIYSGITNAAYNASKGGIVSKIQLSATESEETPYKITVTVKNADNDKPIEGATVSSTFDYEFTNPTTDANGQAVGEMTAGSHTVYAEAENFEENSATTTVQNNDSNVVTVLLTPTRVDAALPTMYDEGLPVSSTATVTKLNYDDDPAYAWNNKSVTANYAGGSTQPLPTGKYRVSLSAYGYRSVTVYMTVAYPDIVKYYSDEDCSEEIDPREILATKLGDATYTIDFTEDETNRTVKATVKLKNIVTTSGTLGLSYDPDLFTFNPDDSDDFVLNKANDITLASTPETEYYRANVDEWNTDMGYYVFRWTVGDKWDEEEAKKVLDTELDETEIAELTFHLKDDAEWDEVASDSFGIMPWTETDAAKAYKDWYDEKYANNPEAAGNYLFEEHWREVDVENSPYSLGIGRIESSKAVVNGIDMGGFFQTTVNDNLGSENLVSFYDVMSVVNMFDTNTTSLRFTVIDAETGDPIKGAKITLYPTDEMPTQTDETNTKGIARFKVDSTVDYYVNYTYTVTLNGYWTIEAAPVTVQPNVANNVEVELVKKIYHEADVKVEGVELVNDMDLGGERYGYNGRDFHFRAKAAPGYMITTYPKEAYVVIGEVEEEGYVMTTITLTEADDHMFTLDASFLHQAELTLEKLQELYEDVGNDFEQPNENGYRSYNIEITFDQYKAEPKPLQVSGLAGDNGKVSYDKDTPVNGGLEAKTVTEDKEYVVKGIIPVESGKEQTGTFTFEADDGYMVEKVFINGVQTHDYDNLDTFDYSFGKPTMDGSIAVTFWDGENASTDSIVTLVVGDYGAVNVTNPEANAEVGVRETTRTYLNPAPDVTFTTVPDTGYQLYSIETQIDDGARVPYDLSGITDLASQEDNSFDFRPEASHNKKIYVTFKNPNAPKTPTIFVKSYVERGSGTITPFGILVYNIYDTVELDLAANDGWDAWGVKVSPFGTRSEGVEYAFPVLNVTNEYVIDSIENDTEVGAIFEEHRYVVKGKVDLSQNMSLTDGPWAATNNTGILSGATVTFVRTADTEGRELDEQTPVWTVTTADRKNAVFSIEIPVGTWTVTVSKQGYVNYIITNYVFDANEENAVEGAYDFSAKTIVPFIGSTTDGRSISVNDIAGIRSGLRENINDTAKAKADVDNNGIVDVTDMTFVLKNFGERTTYKPFEAFDSN